MSTYYTIPMLIALIWKFIYLYSFVFEPNREVLLWSSRRAAAGRRKWHPYLVTREREYTSRISAIRVRRRRGSVRRRFRYWYYPCYTSSRVTQLSLIQALQSPYLQLHAFALITHQTNDLLIGPTLLLLRLRIRFSSLPIIQGWSPFGTVVKRIKRKSYW